MSGWRPENFVTVESSSEGWLFIYVEHPMFALLMVNDRLVCWSGIFEFVWLFLGLG
jgi:hypothetical protein